MGYNGVIDIFPEIRYPKWFFENNEAGPPPLNLRRTGVLNT